MERLRIYVPGMPDDIDRYESLSKIVGVKEIRRGLNLPTSRRLVPVYEIEFEGSPIPPKLWQGNTINAKQFDEIDQYRIIPPQSAISLIFTTAYRQNKVEESELMDVFSHYPYTTGIYKGEHPDFDENRFDERLDGIIVIAENADLDEIIETINKLNPPFLTVAKETILFSR